MYSTYIHSQTILEPVLGNSVDKVKISYIHLFLFLCVKQAYVLTMLPTGNINNLILTVTCCSVCL